MNAGTASCSVSTTQHDPSIERAQVPLSGAGVTVAVLDSGYRPHADLVANVVGGYDFVSADSQGVVTHFVMQFAEGEIKGVRRR